MVDTTPTVELSSSHTGDPPNMNLEGILLETEGEGTESTSSHEYVNPCMDINAIVPHGMLNDVQMQAI